MGLFSFLDKNKQEAPSGESEFYSRAEEDSQAARGRTKRKRGKGAKSEPVDPVLPEKKRARRRLVGAVALVLAAIIGLPMILDSEPKPVPDDIAIQIPSKDKLPPPMAPAEFVPAGGPAGGPVGPGAIPATQLEPAIPVASANASAASTMAANARTATSPAPSANKTDVKTTDASLKSEHKEDAAKTAASLSASTTEKADGKTAEAKSAAAKAASKTEQPVVEKGDEARAAAILEGKDVDAKSATSKKSGQFVLQVAALASQEKVNELRSKLSDAGFKSFTQKVPTASGDRIRVRIGPFASKDEANSALAKLSKLGMNAKLVPS
jgi:DedD protein